MPGDQRRDVTPRRPRARSADRRRAGPWPRRGGAPPRRRAPTRRAVDGLGGERDQAAGRAGRPRLPRSRAVRGARERRSGSWSRSWGWRDHIERGSARNHDSEAGALRYSVDPMQLGLPFNAADAAATPDPPPPFYFVRHRRARRYLLRVEPDGRVRVTIPRGGSRREADAFVVAPPGLDRGATGPACSQPSSRRTRSGVASPGPRGAAGAAVRARRPARLPGRRRSASAARRRGGGPAGATVTSRSTGG